MNTFYYGVVLFLVSLQVNAAINYLAPTDKLPKEIVYLTESLQDLQKPNPEKLKKIQELIKDLDLSFQALNKEELFFLTKSEIYKTTLSFRPSVRVKNDTYNKEVIEKINAKLKTQSLNSFSQWLITSIIKDLNDIFNDKAYPSFLNELNRNIISSSSSKRIQKRLNFLLPWVESFLNEDTKLFEYSLIPLMDKILSKIHLRSQQLLKFRGELSSLDKSKGLVFFTPESKISTDPKDGSSVEQILDPLIGKLKNKNLPTPVDDWEMNEDDFAKGLTPIENQNTDDNYKAPDVLPEPTDDW